MDMVMQAIKEAIFLNTLVFIPISLNPLGFIDKLFQMTNGYSVLER